MPDTPNLKLRIRDVSTDGVPLLDDTNGIELHRLWVAIDSATGEPLAMSPDRSAAFEQGVCRRQQLKGPTEFNDTSV